MFAFLPCLVFFVMAPLSVSLALWLAFAAAFAIGIRAFGAYRTVRIFDACGLVLFGALALYAGFVETDFGAAKTGLVLEAGFLAAILWSLASHRPFTAQYHWLKGRHDPQVVARAHILLTAIWATSYAIMAAISTLSVVMHRLMPGWAGVLGLLVFAATLTFTWQFGVYIDKRGGDVALLRRR
jgi:hypothetical protein